MMTRFFAAVALMTAAGAASAADLPSRKSPATAPAALPMFTWQGAYVGASAGASFGTTGASETGLPAGNVDRNLDYALNHQLRGGLFGLQAGYNWQSGMIVTGVEADLSAANIGGSGRVSGVAVNTVAGNRGDPTNVMLAKERISAFGTLRARIGVAMPTPKLLVYATGGLAYANVQYSGYGYYAFGPTIYAVTKTTSRIGGTIGGGAEYALSQKWSLKGEYLYFELPKYSITAFNPFNAAFSSRFDSRTRGSLLRTGLNYRF
jgi:outer membrane immunogenic protein